MRGVAKKARVHQGGCEISGAGKIEIGKQKEECKTSHLEGGPKRWTARQGWMNTRMITTAFIQLSHETWFSIVGNDEVHLVLTFVIKVFVLFLRNQ